MYIRDKFIYTYKTQIYVFSLAGLNFLPFLFLEQAVKETFEQHFWEVFFSFGRFSSENESWLTNGMNYSRFVFKGPRKFKIN